MKSTWEFAIKAVGITEGGEVDDPDDPGGRTNMGITQKTLNAWRDMHGEPRADVWTINRDEADEILRAQYWDTVRGDDLPKGVDYAVFDFGVNSGPGTAVRFLQRVLGVRQDGIVGAHTLAAARGANPTEVINRLSDKRLAYVKTLEGWRKYGKGWTKRIARVRAQALHMAVGGVGEVGPALEPVPAKADPDTVSAAARAQDAMKSPEVLAGLPAVTGLVAASKGLEGPIAFAAAIALVAIVGFMVFRLVARRKDSMT
ncbi:MAG: acetylmuramidase [Alphaproteobacteria bacterium]|nr:MAG: acetylmuramidase [Alphaproteobacteria bacterium]